MRVALVIPGGVDPGGRERVVPFLLWFMERLARRHEVHAFVTDYFDSPREYRLHGAFVHDLGRRFGPRGRRDLRQLRNLLGALRGHGPFDVLHGLWSLRAEFYVTLASLRLRVPCVVSLTGGELTAMPDIRYGAQRNWTGRLQVNLIRRFAGRVVVGSAYMRRIAQRHGINPAVIEMGADSGLFRPPAQAPAGPPWRLLHVATLNRVKDQGTLLKAVARAVADEPSTHLDVIGEDTLGGELNSLCASLGIGRHVTFHGSLPSPELLPFYQRAQLCVLSSRHDASPLTVMEAALCGVPTVGTAVGHIAEGAPGRSWAVPAGDHTRLAEGIVRLLRDGEERTRMGEESLAWARSRDIDWTVAQYEAQYASLGTAAAFPEMPCAAR